jgi:hypothetical protein
MAKDYQTIFNKVFVLNISVFQINTHNDIKHYI